MLRYAWLLPFATILFFMGCSGGSNSDPPGAAFISVSVDSDGDFIEAEMIKDISSTTAIATVTISSNFDNLSSNVGTIRVETYEVTYTRSDGGSITFPSVTGRVDQTLSVDGNSNLPLVADFEIVVFSTETKAFSDFTQEFNQTLQPVTFDCLLTIRGQDLNGDSRTASAGFKVQAAVFQPTDELQPTIGLTNQTENLALGDDYIATWTAFNRIDGGTFTLPWGQIVNLDASFFPVGSLSVNTAFLADRVAPGTTSSFNSGILTVFNPFGSAQTNIGNDVMITAPEPQAPPPPIPVVIDEFFTNKTSVVEGESVTLTWVTSGATSLEILPDTYSGVPVSFAGKDLSFDSVTIIPDQTVTPILRATNASGSVEQVIQASPGGGGLGTITVEPIVNTVDPPTIVFFQPSRATVSTGNQVTLTWGIDGAVDRIELFPINGERVDVTGRDSLRVPPLACPDTADSQTYTLIVTGQDGSIQNQSTVVACEPNANMQVMIQNVIQQPGTRIDNDNQGSFSFNILDPERRDSTWRVRRIAGDRASFAPPDGRIPGGLGGASVSFNDEDGNGNGFITFEISAWDDNLFGLSLGSTRAVELVNFQTDAGPLTGELPVITEASFIPAGDPDGPAPSGEGVIEFKFSDIDTLDLRWTVSIIAGDFGGTFSRGSGTVSTGQGEISVRYLDDSDTPEAPVIFKIEVIELGTNNPKSVIEILEVDKSASETTGTGTGTGGGTTGEVISLAFTGLFDNTDGNVNATDQIVDQTLYYNADLGNPQFFRNMDLSGPVDGASMVFDLLHNTNPSQINVATYSRDFGPTGTIENNGSLILVGFFDGPGLTGNSTGSATDGGIGRWNMPFDINRFSDNGSPLNLPTTGFFDYSVNVTATDAGGTVVNLPVQLLRVTVP